jgi:hypothetical protein
MSLYSQLFLRETASPYGDINRNSTLSFRDLDQNFIFLKERDLNQLRVDGSNLIYETLGGTEYSVNIGGTATGDTNTFVTGFTFNSPSLYKLTISQNEGEPPLTVDLSSLASDVYVLSGSYDPSTGDVEFTNSTGGTFVVSGFTTGMTDSYTDAATLNGNTIEFDNNIQGSNFYNVDLTPVISGFTTGNTLQEVLDNGSTAVGIATDVSINKTGGTHDTTWSLTDNDGGVSQTDGTWTGANKVETSSLSYLQLTNGTITSQIAASKTEVKMDWTDAGGNNILAINSTSNTFTDGINSKGLEYASDYSSNFTNESLVTKRYVDNSISGFVETSLFNTYTGNTETVLNSKLNISDFNTYSGNVQTQLDGKTNNTEFTSHTGDTNNPHQTSFSNLTSTAHTHTLSEITDFNSYSGSVQTQLDTKIETASNIGGGEGLFSGKSGTDLQFRSISGGSNTTATTVGDVVRIDVSVPADVSLTGSPQEVAFMNASGDDLSYDSGFTWDGIKITVSSPTDNDRTEIHNNYIANYREGNDSNLNLYTYGDASKGAEIQSFKYRGTIDTPTALLNGDLIASHRMLGYDGSTVGTSALIELRAAETFSSTTRGSTYTINTCAIGEGSPSERFRIGSDGNTSISGSLNISIIGGTTSVTNLGVDIDGNIVSGSTSDNFYVTGGTLTDGTLTLERNDNQTFDITGFTEGCEVIVTNVGSGNSQLYSLPLSANTGAFFDYVVSGSTGVRSGSLTTVFSGNSANIADLSTDDIGDTTDVSFNVTIAGGEANLNVSAVTGTWRIEFTPTKCDVTSTVNGGEINTGTNIGGGEGIFSAKSGVELQFKTLTSTGGTVTITSTGDTVNLESSGGGGGSGIVYIASGTTQADLLDDTNNWDINGEYTGTSITGTLQGYAYYNSDYWFTAVDDNDWIRLIRG